MKRIALINDLSAVGRCSLTVQLPILSSMGYEVCPLPTAVLSNHTRFPNAYKADLTESVRGILQQWRANGFRFDAVMVGYLGSIPQAELILDWIREEKAVNPEMRVLLDPCMGDRGRLYRGLGEAYAGEMRKLMGAADIVSPNLTEACFLGDFDYAGVSETLDYCQSDAGRVMVLHSLFSELSHLGQGTILITGVPAGEEIITAVAEPGREICFLRNSRVPEDRHSTGDLFLSVLAGYWLRDGDLLRAAGRGTEFTCQALAHSRELKIPVELGVQFEDLLPELQG